jgi:hypothetical protein
MDSPMFVQVSQSLFIRHGFDGSTWEFAALANGGCALLRDGAAVTTADGTEPCVEQLLGEFLRVTTAYAVEVPSDVAAAAAAAAVQDGVLPGDTGFSPQAA